MSQKGGFDEKLLRKRMPGGELDHGDILFDLNGEQPADVVVVQNYLKYDQKIEARQGYVWKWDNEPIVRNKVFHGYDRVYSHAEYPGHPHRIATPPILDWWLDKSFDELTALHPPAKDKSISAIASTKTSIPGHRRRTKFVDAVEEFFPEVQVYGHGRSTELTDKWSGIAPYRFSIAIENTSKADYWTEKISDCFLSYTVPLYFGATNISDYFPEGSFIWLPIDNPTSAFEVIRQVLDDDWSERLEALAEARRRVLEKYSFFAQLATRVRRERELVQASPRVTRRVHGRRVRQGGWIRGKGIGGNARAQVNRLEARHK